MVLEEPSFKLVCGVALNTTEQQTKVVFERDTAQVPCFSTLAQAFKLCQAEVVVDFTTQVVVEQHIRLAATHGVRAVVGTTGLSSKKIEALSKFCAKKKAGVIMAPNFSIGAILMMQFAAQAAKYLPHVEIIELHHDHKLDAPSGTAVRTAELVSQARVKSATYEDSLDKEVLQGARGAVHKGSHVHSVRLPGLLAHHQVLLSDEGQLLSIRHESFNRSSFMPGVKMAIKKVLGLNKMVYGLDKLVACGK
jgi:4-hydroxy-tetrahydrodipicolinate reductase